MAADKARAGGPLFEAEKPLGKWKKHMGKLGLEYLRMRTNLGKWALTQKRRWEQSQRKGSSSNGSCLQSVSQATRLKQVDGIIPMVPKPALELEDPHVSGITSLHPEK